MAVKKTGDMYRCTTEAFVEIGGREYHVKRGELVRDGDPLLKALPGSFEKADDVVRPEVEQATASPGEKRGA